MEWLRVLLENPLKVVIRKLSELKHFVIKEQVLQNYMGSVKTLVKRIQFPHPDRLPKFGIKSLAL